MKIVRNAAYCAHCRQTIESRYPEETTMCAGAHFAVSGGLDHIRRVFFVDNVDWSERSITEGEPKKGKKRVKKVKGELQWR